MNAVYSSRSFGGDKRRAWEAVVSQLYASMDVQVRGVRNSKARSRNACSTIST